MPWWWTNTAASPASSPWATCSGPFSAIFPTPSDEADDDWFHELADNRFALPGATPLEDFNSRFHANFEIEDIRTLGGLVLHHFGELPTEGASIEIWPFRFTAQRIEANRIVEVLVELLPGAKPNALETGAGPTPPPPEAGSESVAPDEPARP